MTQTNDGSPNSHHHGDSCCQQSVVPRGVYQTLDEMDFERGVWSAAVDGDVDRVQNFLDKKIDPNVPDKSGISALHYACRNGNENIVRLLLQNGANPNIQTRSGQATPLHRAAYAGHLGSIECLLEYGASPSWCDDDGKSPLHKAAERGHTIICKRLIETDPTIANILDKRKKTALGCVSISDKDLQDLLQPHTAVSSTEGPTL